MIIQDMRGISLNKKQKKPKKEVELVKTGRWEVTRMVRPGTVTFFYSINGKAFTQDGLTLHFVPFSDHLPFVMLSGLPAII